MAGLTMSQTRKDNNTELWNSNQSPHRRVEIQLKKNDGEKSLQGKI